MQSNTMSALRQHAQDKLDNQYKRLYEICKKIAKLHSVCVYVN